MENILLKTLKNIAYSVSSNLTSFLISMLVVLIIPKLIGVEEYGYWQLYIFYSSYIGFFQFGWNDGIYLRYGGALYTGLDKKLFFSQFWMLLFSQVIIAILILAGSSFFHLDNNEFFITIILSLCLIISGSSAMFIFILQATNRIKDYAIIMIVGRVAFISAVFCLIPLRSLEYQFLLIADLFGRLISFIYAIYICRDMVFLKFKYFYLAYSEITKNIGAGIQLLFSNIASMLIIGIVRVGMVETWSIELFGKVSLTLSITNMMLLFINAIGIILFPILRKVDSSKLSDYYKVLRDVLVITLFGVLILYYPLKSALTVWLPQYEDSMKYMILIFPTFLFEGKIALLFNTYLKALRKETLMLKINLTVVIMSVIFTIISTKIFANINFAVFTILILLMFRAVLTELLLAPILQIKILKDIIYELAVISVFILAAWFLDYKLAIFLYITAFIIFVLIKKKDLIKAFYRFKNMLKNR